VTAVVQYTWPDAPAAVATQVGRVTDGVRELLVDNLLGVYLHGSLAMGGFNPDRSDIDLLAVTRERISAKAKHDVTRLLLELSSAPCPVEISFLSRPDLVPWTFPTPFDFHFSEKWRERIAADIASGAWRQWEDTAAKDPDLAAHITVLRHRGIVLWGQPIDRVFPEVPISDYVAAIWDHDMRGAAASIGESPVYAVLNFCRVLLFLEEGRIASKDQGGEWGSHALPTKYRDLVRQALGVYRGDVDAPRFNVPHLRRFAEYMEDRIRGHLDGSAQHPYGRGRPGRP